MSDSLILTDQDQRRKALDAERSYIVQAPAGSGKTGLLVRRYLALLAGVDRPEEILAITFTRKATAEMADRIMSALTLTEETNTDPEMVKLADAVRKKDASMGWNLANNPARLRIQTIDAFCFELVRYMPWSARFGAVPRILDNQEAVEFYYEAARKTLNHVEEKNENARRVATILELVNVQFSRAQMLLAQMLGKRDLWLRGIGVESRQYYEAMWKEVIDAALHGFAELLSADLTEKLDKLVLFAARNLAAEKPDHPLSRAYKNSAIGFSKNEVNAENLESWRALYDLFFTIDDDPRKQWNKNQGFPPGSDDEKLQARQLLDALLENDSLIKKFRQVKLLPPAKFSDAQWIALDALLHVLPLAAAELRLLFTDQNVADYAEISQRAELALGNSTAPTDLALMMDEKISHLLMDEVQDTSRAHLDIISKLISDWSDGDGRTAFFVGDPMQSIYRFREADVGNFLAIQEIGIAGIKPENLKLESNFRSSATLVNWFNETFTKVFPQTNDLNDTAVKYESSIAIRKPENEGGVFTWGLLDQDNHGQAIAVAKQIQTILSVNPDAEIGVLGRSRKHLVEIADSLNRHNLLFHANELQSLDSNPVIQDLISLTRALIHPADRIAWLSILRAPWCGLELADLTTLINDDDLTPIPELAENALNCSQISNQGAARLRRFLQQMDLPLKRLGRISLRNNLQSAWIRLGGPSVVGEQNFEDCEQFFELVEELDRKPGLLSIDDLVTATQHLWSTHDADARIQLLTIHKAKGLEFEYIFIPFLDKWSGQNDTDLLQWARTGDSLLISTIGSADDDNDRHNAYLRWVEKRRSGFEDCRLLYVACTRAKRQLHLFAKLANDDDGEIKSPDPRSPLHLLWPALETQFCDNLLTDAPTVETEPSNQEWMWRTPTQWDSSAVFDALHNIDTPAEETSQPRTENIEFSWASETLRITGTAIHHLFHRLDQIKLPCHSLSDEAALSITEPILVEQGLPVSELSIAKSNIIIAASNLRQDPKAHWIFSPDHRDIHAEWPLTGNLNGVIENIIIDRSFIDQHGIRWIIDYKSSRHTDDDIESFLESEKTRYFSQMSKYAKIVSLLGNQPIQIGLYFPLLARWIEWPD